MNDFPHAHFGPPSNPALDWRKRPDNTKDDDEMRVTPHSVKAILGFDPEEIAAGMGHTPTQPNKKPETAASDWWDALNDAGKKRYLKDHPESSLRYGGHGVRPDHPEFREALVNTPGAKLHPEGMQLNVTRFQKPEQDSEESVRDGVFFLPKHMDKRDKNYSDGTNTHNYGGSVKFQGTAKLKAPIIVKAGLGGKAPEAAYAALFGKPGLANMQREAHWTVSFSGTSIYDRTGATKADKIEKVRNFLKEFGGNPDKAQFILDHSKQGNQLYYALQENVIANQLKNHGYDSMLAYHKSKGAHRFSELFDLRHSYYPGSDVELAGYSHDKDWDHWLFKHEDNMKEQAHNLSPLMRRKIETADSWWTSKSPEQQKAYVANHPMTKLKNHLASLPSQVGQKFTQLSNGTKKGIASWHSKTPKQKVQSAKEGAVHAAKRLVHHVKEHLKHEYHTYKGAGAAIGHLASGKKWSELEPHHKKHLRTALIHAGLTAGSMALGDLTGGAGEAVHHSIGHILGAFAADHAHHTALLGAGEVGLKTGKDFVKKAVAAMLPRSVEGEVQRLIKLLTEAEIPTSEWISIMHEIEQARKKAAKAKPEKASLHRKVSQLLASNPDDDPDEYSDSFKPLRDVRKPSNIEGTETYANNWWKQMSPGEKHAYLTAHPDSKHAGESTKAAPIKSREDFHKMSAAFHGGRAAHHDAKWAEATNKKDPNAQMVHSEMRRSHQGTSDLHRQALESLAMFRKHHNDYTLGKYNETLGHVKAMTDKTEQTAATYKQPTGVGITRYVQKKDA